MTCSLCSFDILQDGLGGPRSAFPHTITLVAGTQAANPRQNSLALMKLSNLGQGKHGDKVRPSSSFIQGQALQFLLLEFRGSSLGVNLGRRVSTRTVEMKLEQKELDVETLAMTSLPGFVLRKEWQNRVAE